MNGMNDHINYDHGDRLARAAATTTAAMVPLRQWALVEARQLLGPGHTAAALVEAAEEIVSYVENGPAE